ncbi:MAG: YihY family inner membrane protein [Planctomycetes bacterium]|nr:YihY family inner membrane protein [Planctomycetota bacterium]MBI3844140.1 YihY family inner membrane protein [Planctomycetota bacterium]
MYRWLRIAVLAVRGFQRERGHFLAFALTYMTLLSIVPLLAFAFAVAKGLKAQDRLRPFIEQQFGPGLKEVTESLFEAVKNTNAATLSSIGLIFFLWAVLRGLSTFESAFNIIWGVRRSRSLVRKFTDYLSVLAVSPILLVAAIGLTGLITTSTFAKEIVPSGFLRGLARLLPFVVTWAGYAFLYKFLPNTKVRLRSAIVGGVLAGTAYQLVQWGYFHFQVGLVRYSVIYGALASLPIFLIWLQLGWMIVLIGCEIAYVYQHEDTLRLQGLVARASVAERERQALRIVVRVTDQFLNGGEPWDKNSLAKSLGVHYQLVSELVDRLVETQLLAETTGTVQHIVLARDPDRTTAADVVDTVRRFGFAWPEQTADDSQVRVVDRVLGKSHQAESGVLGRYTLRSLADRSRPQTEEDREPEPAIT